MSKDLQVVRELFKKKSGESCIQRITGLFPQFPVSWPLLTHSVPQSLLLAVFQPAQEPKGPPSSLSCHSQDNLQRQVSPALPNNSPPVWGNCKKVLVLQKGPASYLRKAA